MHSGSMPDCGLRNICVFVLFPLALYIYSTVSWARRTRGRPLPPGPRRLPIIGNLLEAPRVRPWFGFRDLCNTYGKRCESPIEISLGSLGLHLGDIVYLRVFGQDNIVLGSATAVAKLMEERTANTSDRLTGPVVRL